MTATVRDREKQRLQVWAATAEAVETVAEVLDPGAWAHADFVVSRNRARTKARAYLDQLVAGA